MKSLRWNLSQRLFHLSSKIIKICRIVFVKIQPENVLCRFDGSKGLPKGWTNRSIARLVRIVRQIPEIDDLLFLVGEIGDMISGRIY